MDTKIALQYIAISLLSGVMLTLLSALYSMPTATDITRFVGITMRGYGFPFFWLKETRVVYADAKPEFTLLYDALITDVLFWFSISLILISIFKLIMLRASVGKLVS